MIITGRNRSKRRFRTRTVIFIDAGSSFRPKSALTGLPSRSMNIAGETPENWSMSHRIPNTRTCFGRSIDGTNTLATCVANWVPSGLPMKNKAAVVSSFVSNVTRWWAAGMIHKTGFDAERNRQVLPAANGRPPSTKGILSKFMVRPAVRRSRDFVKGGVYFLGRNGSADVPSRR